MTGTTASARAWPAARCGDRGSATGWAIGILWIGLLLTMLVVDGANAMTTRASALHTAQQAARVGADQIDLAHLRTTGQIRLDPAAAETAALTWLDQAGATGTATATTEQVDVSVTVTQPTILLAAVGIPTITLSATATAQPIQP